MGDHLGEITRYLWRQSWQLAVLIVAVAVVCSILRNRSAHVRYLLWLIVLAKCLVPPFLTVPLAILPAVQRAESPARLPVARPLAVPGVPNDVSNRSMAMPSISVETDTAQPKTSRFSTAFADQVLAAIWIIGMAVFGCIAVAKVLRSTLRLRQQRKLLPNDLQAVVGELLSDFGMRTHPKVWVLNGIGQPFVWGLLRGDIYLPMDYLKIDNALHRRSILGHEVCHILRFDAVGNSLQVLAQAIFWFHPFVWWANQKIRMEREKCCDEMAVAHLGAGAKEYSTAIVKALITEHESTRPVPSLAVAGPVKDVEERIKTMLRPGKKFYERPSLVAVTIAMLLALLIVPMALVLTARAGTKPSTGKWIQTQGLYGGNIISFAVSGTNLFAGASGAGVFLSTDYGKSWTATGLTAFHVHSLAVSGTNVFAGTAGFGVLRSTDNGKNWTAINNELRDPNGEDCVWALAVIGTNLFVGTFRGVFRSTDNGTSWTAVNNGLTNTNVLALTVSGRNLFAGTGGGVFLSTDNGTSWTEVNNGLTNRGVSALAVSGTNLFAGTRGGGVFLSTNNGANWTAVNNGLTNTDVTAFAVIGTNLFAGTAGSIGPISTSGGGVFRSTDNGTSWTQVNNGLTNTVVSELAVIGTNLFAGTGGDAVFRSTDNGENWTPANNGFTGRRVDALAASGTNLFAKTSYGSGVFRSTDNGTSWTEVNGLTRNVSAIAVSGTNLFAGAWGRGRGVFRSTDNGTSWTEVNNGLGRGFIAALVVSGQYLFAVIPGPNAGLNSSSGGAVFRSTDNGTSWTGVQYLPGRFSALAVIGTNLFAGTGGGVFRSTDSGESWTEANNGLTDKDVTKLASIGTNLFACTYSGGVFRSTDNGANWTEVNIGLTHPGITALAASSTNLFAGSYYFAGTILGTTRSNSSGVSTRSGGVFRSTDNGTSWTEVNYGLPETYINVLIVSGKNLFAATDHGVFMLPDVVK